jgi:Na+/phosphate symporter
MSELEIAGGIALILFGIRFLRKGLDRLFGGRLLLWMSRLTASRPKAFAAGVVAGAATPSSASISLLAVQLLADPRIRIGGVLAMVLGANVGMTVTVQAMAFRIQDYAVVGIVAGVAGFLYAKRDLWRGIGQCLLALGFIFLAIQWIGVGAERMADSERARQVFVLLQSSPWGVFLGTLALVIVLQSSTATIGLGIGLCASGLLGAAQLVPWIAGTNVGVGVSTLIAGWRTMEGRRLGVANILSKLVLALPLLVFVAPSQALFDLLPGDAAQQAATGHTLFNLLTGVAALIWMPAVVRLAGLVVPDPDPGVEAVIKSHLDPRALDTPSLALARATREALRMADKVRAQLEAFWKACRSGDVELARRVQKNDDAVDRHNRELIDYLSRISGEKSPKDNRWQLGLMHFSTELEAVADQLEKNLCDLVAKQRNDGVVLTEADWADLEGVYRKLLARLDRVMSLLSLPESGATRDLADDTRTFNEECRRLQREHYERIRAGGPGGWTSNNYFLDYLNGFRRIHSHITGLAYAMIEPSPTGGAPEGKKSGV